MVWLFEWLHATLIPLCFTKIRFSAPIPKIVTCPFTSSSPCFSNYLMCIWINYDLSQTIWWEKKLWNGTSYQQTNTMNEPLGLSSTTPRITNTIKHPGSSSYFSKKDGWKCLKQSTRREFARPSCPTLCTWRVAQRWRSMANSRGRTCGHWAEKFVRLKAVGVACWGGQRYLSWGVFEQSLGLLAIS